MWFREALHRHTPDVLPYCQRRTLMGAMDKGFIFSTRSSVGLMELLAKPGENPYTS